jgi:hypothetical protein
MCAIYAGRSAACGVEVAPAPADRPRDADRVGRQVTLVAGGHRFDSAEPMAAHTDVRRLDQRSGRRQAQTQSFITRF